MVGGGSYGQERAGEESQLPGHPEGGCGQWRRAVGLALVVGVVVGIVAGLTTGLPSTRKEKGGQVREGDPGHR